MPMTTTMKNGTSWDMRVVKNLLQNSQDKALLMKPIFSYYNQSWQELFYQYHPMKWRFWCLRRSVFTFQQIRKKVMLDLLTSDCVSVFTCLSHRTPRKKSSPPENCLPTQTFKLTSESSTWKPMSFYIERELLQSNYIQLTNGWRGYVVVTLERSCIGN